MKKAVLLLLMITGAVPVTSFSRDYYGAIAYNKYSGAYGYSFNFYRPRGAAIAALRRCGAGCRVVVRFRNSCASYAKGYGASGWAVSPNRFYAMRLSRKECYRYGGRRCYVVTSVCTARPRYYRQYYYRRDWRHPGRGIYMRRMRDM